jgi:hypothetical protein
VRYPLPSSSASSPPASGRLVAAKRTQPSRIVIPPKRDVSRLGTRPGIFPLSTSNMAFEESAAENTPPPSRAESESSRPTPPYPAVSGFMLMLLAQCAKCRGLGGGAPKPRQGRDKPTGGMLLAGSIPPCPKFRDEPKILARRVDGSPPLAYNPHQARRDMRCKRQATDAIRCDRPQPGLTRTVQHLPAPRPGISRRSQSPGRALIGSFLCGPI